MPLNPCQIYFLESEKEHIHSLIYVDNQPYDKVLEIICHHGRNWLKEKDFRNAVKTWQRDEPAKWRELSPNSNRRPNICTSRHEDCSGRGCIEYLPFHSGELPNPTYSYKQRQPLTDQAAPSLAQVHGNRALPATNPASGAGVFRPPPGFISYPSDISFQDASIHRSNMSVGTHSYVPIHAQQSMGHGLWTPTATPTSSTEGFGITQFDPSLSPNTTSHLPQSALQRDNNVPSHAMGAQQGYHGPILDYSNDAQNSNLRELPQNTHMASSTQGHPHAYCGNAETGFEDGDEEDDEEESEDDGEDDTDMLRADA